MEGLAEQLWRQILDTAKETLGEQSFETWFRPIRVQDFSENTLTLELPNKFFQTWIKEHYLGLIKQALSSAIQKDDVEVQLVLTQAEPLSSPEKKEEPKPRRWFFRKPPQPQQETQSADSFKVDARYSFENFVVGPSNRFAHAASMAVGESPARSYNPLFIYGGVGLGKTHLMQAIGGHILKNNPRLKVTYISSEKFTNQLISAIQHRTTTNFREKYRHVDILLIDDIHFIGGKEATQEEFFHTFNALYDAHKQIVLSSDRPPKDIPTLEERLVSRFEWGLVTDIQPPDLETRIAILKKKLEQNKIDVPDDVIFFIADKVRLNIRELEGALIRVVAYSSLTNEKITLDLARSVLKDMLLEDKKLSVEAIQKKVAAHFDIRILDLKAKKRNRAVVYPRQIAMYLTRTLTDFSLPEIGEYFGGRDHTTVLYAYDKIQRDSKKDSNLQDLLDRLVMDIRSD
ncbi:MAG: chromosomal replication initiator protein DnaA [Candidatus Omnitrophota bacterium]|nr:MAG: chromosomal replication initiator protein DnaA [Candidatus Omnitrophota bacterium]